MNEGEAPRLQKKPAKGPGTASSQEACLRDHMEHQLRVERDLALSLRSAGNLDETLALCLHAAIEISSMDAGGIYLVSPETGDLELQCHHGLSESFVAATRHYRADDPSARLIQEGRPVYTRHREMGLPMDTARVEESLRAIASIPIVHRGQLIGGMNVASHKLDEVPQHAKAALEQISTIIGHAIAEQYAQRALQESEERFRLLVENSSVLIWEMRADGVFTYMSPSSREILGHEPSSMVSKSLRTFVSPEDVPACEDNIARVLEAGRSLPGPEIRVKHADGTWRWHEPSITPIYSKSGDFLRFVGVSRDITDRRAAQQALIKEHDHLTFLMEKTGTHFNVLDAGFRLQQVDPVWEALYGDPKGRICYEYFMGRDQPCDSCGVRKALAEDTVIVYEQFLPKERRIIQVHTIPFHDENGQQMVAEFNVDITARKKMEGTLRARLELLEYATSHPLAETLDRALAVTCRMNESPRGALYLVDEESQTLSLHAGSPFQAENPAGQEPAWDTAVRTGKPVFCNRCLSSSEQERGSAPRDAPERALVVPVLRRGTVVAVLGVADAPEPYTDEHAESIQYFGDVAWEIAEQLHAKEAVRLSEQRFQKLFDSSIRSLGRITELRDPYTAGHQRRVAQLACQMAEHLKVDGDSLMGIRVASLLHDIGKASIPTEILSKPGKLTALEYGIIQQHPEVGQRILDEISLPWHVSQIVAQHHERLDGSGYPHGIKEDEILMEAKILAVADVVEAMSSHRPYRTALGVDAALGEIQKGRGHLFSSAVVDACVSLFSEGFAFVDSNPPYIRFSP